MPPLSLPALSSGSPTAWEEAVYAFLVEKRARSGSTRTVESYARMLWPFFRVPSGRGVGPISVQIGLTREAKAVFDSIIVVTDRRILDKQIRDMRGSDGRLRPAPRDDRPPLDFGALPSHPDCTHREITAYSVKATGEPVPFWSCAACGRRFAPTQPER